MEFKPTLGQLSNFRYHAEQDKHFDIFDWNNNKLDEMSLTEFNYLKRCWTNNKYITCKKILSKYLITKAPDTKSIATK